MPTRLVKEPRTAAPPSRPQGRPKREDQAQGQGWAGVVFASATAVAATLDLGRRSRLRQAAAAAATSAAGTAHIGLFASVANAVVVGVADI